MSARTSEPGKPLTASQHAVLNYVTAHPDTTAPQITTDTGLGKSTVTHALSALEARGDLRRTAADRTGGRHSPDHWNLATTLTTLSGATRLSRGQLEQPVLDHMAAHPDLDWTGYQIGKAIGRSAGAVALVLDRLCDRDLIDRVSEKPLRYRYRPTT